MKVLDKGFVNVEEVMGSDLTVVNSARVSFGRRKEELDESDIKLVNYLAKHKHYSPFRHIMVQFHIKAPEFVMRQWYKHVVGIEWTSSYPTKDHGWNEISRRYIEIDDFYVPDIWRKQSESNKQASQYDEKGNPISLDREDSQEARARYYATLNQMKATIQDLIDLGVAKEQAQILLPISFYTEIYWTASFQAIMNFLELRNDTHAQYEIRQYALAVNKFMWEHFPVATEAWLIKDD